MIKTLTFKFFLLVTTMLCYSQNYTGNITEINENGFYKILLSPEIRSASLSNMDFFRILDSKQNEVSYVVINDKKKIKPTYLPFAFKSINNSPDSITSIIIANEKQIKLDHLVIKIANTKVNKTYSISGSNDKNEWFGLATNQVFLGLNDTEKTSVEQIFWFPINDYKYLKFEFSNKKSLPLNILDIALYENAFSTVSKIEISHFEIKTHNNSEKKTTQITVIFTMPQRIESMVFDVENDVYLREAKILVNRTKKAKKRTGDYKKNIFDFELNSETNNTFTLPYIFEKEIIIEIQNHDNQPLNIKYIKFFQKPLYVVTYLKSSETYQAIVDTTWQKPVYDLVNFKTSFNTSLPEAVITNFHKINAQSKSLTVKKSFWQTNTFMWICIISAIAMIGYFALVLLKDLKK